MSINTNIKEVLLQVQKKFTVIWKQKRIFLFQLISYVKRTFPHVYGKLKEPRMQAAISDLVVALLAGILLEHFFSR